MKLRRDRPRYISDHPAMALVAPALAAVIVTLILVCAAAASGQTTDEYIAKARAAARSDQHRAAIAWYLKAIEQSPRKKWGLGRELGDQYTWAESPDTAITWYDTYLGIYPDDLDANLGKARALSWADRHAESLALYRKLLPDAGAREVEVRLGIARVLSWQDKLWPARREYEAILEDHPGNLEAQIGRARVINWSGRHREARGLFAELLQDHPDNDDVRSGLASAHNWMGRPDRAIEVLEDHGKSRSLATLASEIRQARAPGASYTFWHNEDSDDVEHDAHTVRAEASPMWLMRVGAQYTRTDISQPALPEVTRDHFAASIAQRFSEALALTVNAGYETNEFDRDALGPEEFWQDEHDLFTLDAYLTITPTDWVRADVGVARASIDNPVPIFRGITLTETTAGLDWRLAPTVLTVTAGSFTDYNDGNRRFSVSERVQWQPAQRLPVPLRHRFTLTTGAAYYDFDQTLDHGYYNPDRYVSLYQQLGVAIDLGRRARLEMSGRIATERENTGDWFSAGSFDASASVRAVGRLMLRAGYYNSRSRLDTRAGYERNGFWITVGM